MAWVALVAAGLFETAFAVCLKLSDGLRVVWPTVGFALSALASFGLLTVAVRELDVGPAYAVWTGIGAAGGGDGRHDLPRRRRLDHEARVDRPDPGRRRRAQPVRCDAVRRTAKPRPSFRTDPCVPVHRPRDRNPGPAMPGGSRRFCACPPAPAGYQAA